MTSAQTRRLILRAVPTLPEMTDAAHVALSVPYMHRSTVDRALREMAGVELEVFDGSRGRLYARAKPGVLL